MVFEIPLDQINELQLLLRKEVSLSWYEPEKEDPFTLPKLPSVSETIARLDPSPPYLRCKHCKGKLLRGVQSSICVFCGTNPQMDLPPDPIKFKDTVGYRFLLDSLQLDGSEMVGPINEGDDSSRARSASKEEIPLFELLDLEILRPSELDGPQTGSSDEAAFQSKGSLGLAAVDLDRFFAQRKSASDAFEDQLDSEKLVDGATDNPFQTNENLSLFQNVLVPEKTRGPSEGQSGISFSGWEADFQPASSEAIHKESKSFDHSDVDLDEVFGSGNASLGAKKNDSSNRSASMENDWFQGDMQRTSEVTSRTGKPEFMFDLNYAKTVESASSSTRNLDWMLAEPGQESQNKTTDNVTTDEAADSLDAWDDFTGSVSTQEPSSSVSNSKITSQTGEAKVTANLYDTKTAEGNHSSSTKNFDWMQDDDDLWPGSNDKTTSPVPTDEVTDSINAWDDFIGSAGTQDPSGSFPNSVMASQTERSEITVDLNDRKVVESNNNFDWMGDDLWQGSYNKATDTVTTEEVSGSFDEWNGFTSSATTQDHSSNVWEQSVNQTSSAQRTSEMNLFSLSSNSNVVNFGGFKQHDLFSEQFSDPLSSAGANIQAGAFSGRVASVDATGGNSGDASSAKSGSNVDVEMLLSQMHDLSFMLESELSVPPKQRQLNVLAKETKDCDLKCLYIQRSPSCCEQIPQLSTPHSSLACHSVRWLTLLSPFKKIQIQRDDTTFDAYVVGKEDAPGIVVLQEWWGVDFEIKNHAVKISQLGYGFKALIPDLYRGKVGLDAAEAQHLMDGLDWQGAVKDIHASVNWLKTHGSNKVGVTGYCMGGALSIASSVLIPEIDAVVSFYGVPPSQLADPSQAKVPVQAHFGELDNVVGFSDVTEVAPLSAFYLRRFQVSIEALTAQIPNLPQVSPERGNCEDVWAKLSKWTSPYEPRTAAKTLEEKLKSCGVAYEVHMYPGNGHAFMNRSAEGIKRRKSMGMSDEDEAAVQLAWSRFQSWMTRYLSD